MTPRRCQSEAAGAVLTAIRSGRGGLVRMPTRSGKSIAMGLVLRRLHERAELPRTIVVTSRTMLVDDLVHTFWRLLDPAARSFSPADLDRETKAVRKARAQSEIVGRWDGHVQRPGLVTVTTYPSLSDLDPAPLLFCDEAHRTKGMALRALVERTPIRIGWTATPHGRDGSDRLPFERLLYELTYADAVAQGVVVPWVPVQPEHVPERGDESLYDPARVLGVALDLIAARGGPDAIGPILFTAPNLTVAAWMAEQIRARGWSSEAAIPAHGRRAIRSLIRAFGAGEPQTLVTVDLLAEGVTIPSLRALALCAAPRGRNHLCQVAGRVMGTCAPDRWGEKTEALLFDPACILASYRLEHPAALGEARSVPRSVRAVARASIAALVALPWAQAVEPLSAWSMALLRLAEGYARHPAPGRRPGMAERSLPASERERAALLRLLPLLRWVAGPRTGEGREKVGEAHREAIRRVAEQDGAIPCGVVLDLIGVLRLVAEVSERAVRASRAPGLAAGARVGVRAQGYLRVPAGLALPAAGAPLAASSAADVVEGA